MAHTVTTFVTQYIANHVAYSATFDGDLFQFHSCEVISSGIVDGYSGFCFAHILYALQGIPVPLQFYVIFLVKRQVQEYVTQIAYDYIGITQLKQRRTFSFSYLFI